MTHRALALGLPLSLALPSAARAQACVNLPVTVKIQCKAELLGTSGATRTLEASAPATKLSMQAVGKQATIPMGTTG